MKYQEHFVKVSPTRQKCGVKNQCDGCNNTNILNSACNYKISCR